VDDAACSGAIHPEEDMTFSDAEIDTFVPKELKRAKPRLSNRIGAARWARTRKAPVGFGIAD
jgi:hypothetical protein